MARYDLDLRMGLDNKLIDANLDVGALSYSIDKQNLYIDALKEDKISIERQMLNADKAYSIRNKNEQIVAESGLGDLSFISGFNPSALKTASQAFGTETVANNENCLAIGKFNISDEYGLFVVGNGESDDNRLNAFIVFENGDAEIQNNLKIGNILEVPKIFYDGISINFDNLNNVLVIEPALNVTGDFQSTNINVLETITANNIKVNNYLEVGSLDVKDDIQANSITVDNSAYFNNSINVSNGAYATNFYKLNKDTNEYEEVASEEFVRDKLEETKETIMEEVQEIADSIITDVWYRDVNPPQTVKQAKLLWIRYDSNNESLYGNGVLYYFNPTLLNENLTDEQVALESNWIPMSAIYT